jgi:hypothetical protein
MPGQKDEARHSEGPLFVWSWRLALNSLCEGSAWRRAVLASSDLVGKNPRPDRSPPRTEIASRQPHAEEISPVARSPAPPPSRRKSSLPALLSAPPHSSGSAGLWPGTARPLCHSERSDVTLLPFAGGTRVTSRSRGIPLHSLDSQRCLRPT